MPSSRSCTLPEGHPQRATLLARHLYETIAARGSADLVLERRGLKAIAHRTVPLAGAGGGRALRYRQEEV